MEAVVQSIYDERLATGKFDDEDQSAVVSSYLVEEDYIFEADDVKVSGKEFPMLCKKLRAMKDGGGSSQSQIDDEFQQMSQAQSI